MMWNNPGVPSLLVTYETTNDFFFSGHTAIAVLGCIELIRYRPHSWLVTVIGVVFANLRSSSGKTCVLEKIPSHGDTTKMLCSRV